MRSALFAAVLSLLAAPLSAAPEYLDGSEAAFDPSVVTGITMAMVKENYRDPNSAQYHGLVSGGALDIDGGIIGKPTHVCGFINLKNGYGAYAGFKPFMFDLRNANFTVLESKPGEFMYDMYRSSFEPMGCARFLDLPEG